MKNMFQIWNKVGSVRGMALVRKGKGDKERRVLFASQTTDTLHSWVKERKAATGVNFLFVTRYGKPIQPGGIYKAVRKAAQRAGVKARPHVLRHTFATNYLDRGGTLADAQTLLGHEDIVTTMIYLSVSMERLRQQHKQLSLLDELLKQRD
jgi:integrase/recombinase XerD